LPSTARSHAALGGAAAWPIAARAQRPAVPVVGFLSGSTPELYTKRLAAFREGLSETGYSEGRNVAIEYRWAEGQFDRLPAMAADLIRLKVAVLGPPGLILQFMPIMARYVTAVSRRWQQLEGPALHPDHASFSDSRYSQ
jgi:hypothetical protein